MQDKGTGRYFPWELQVTGILPTNASLHLLGTHILLIWMNLLKRATCQRKRYSRRNWMLMLTRWTTASYTMGNTDFFAWPTKEGRKRFGHNWSPSTGTTDHG